MRAMFKGQRCEVGVSFYVSNGVPAIHLTAPNGEPMAVATVNMEDYGMDPGLDRTYVRDHDIYAGMYQALVEGGVVKAGGRRFVAGPYNNLELVEAELTEEASDEYLDAYARRRE